MFRCCLELHSCQPRISPAAEAALEKVPPAMVPQFKETSVHGWCRKASRRHYLDGARTARQCSSVEAGCEPLDSRMFQVEPLGLTVIPMRIPELFGFRPRFEIRAAGPGGM